MAGNPFIICRNLRKSFNGKEVLRGVDLTVEEGETLAILGASGSGKTVLLKHLNGLMRPDSGSVFLEGEEISALGEEALLLVRKKVGMVFQGSALFDSLTLEENIAYPLREHRGISSEEIAGRVREILSLVDLSGSEHLYPAEISGGMRKRGALARALALGPKGLLYDEPTTGLDPLMTSRINALIRDMQRKLGVTSVMVTHDLSSAFAVADRIAFLFEGQIRFIGTKEELRTSPSQPLRQFLHPA